VGLGCCFVLGGVVCLAFCYGHPVGSVLFRPHWYQQPLLLFFTAMLLLALAMNLLAVFGVALPQAPFLAVRRDQTEPGSFNQLAKQFLQQQSAAQLHGEDNFYLQPEGRVLYYLQSSADEPLDIIQLRQIFQLMLRHQCHSALALVRNSIQTPAQIFAVETNIRILDKQQLSQWLKA
jgi:hypothetical protein